MKFLKTFLVASSLLIASTLTAYATSSVTDLMEYSVKISNQDGSSGSGTVLYSKESKRGVLTYVITNNHVIASGKNGRIIVNKRIEGKQELQEATVVAADSMKDLALLRLEDSWHMEPYAWDIPDLSFDEPIPGVDVTVVGYPMGLGPIVTTGTYTRISYFMESSQKQMLTSAPVIWGNSGGGLYQEVDNDYKYIGTIQAVHGKSMDVTSGPEGWGETVGSTFLPIYHISYAIPMDTLKEFLEENNYEWIID